MKKGLIYSLCVLFMASSCGTGSHMEQGAASGVMFGSIFGSALGGVIGGPCGSDVGTLFGMVGGAMVGASVGSAVDKNEQAAISRHRASANDDSAYGDDAYGGRRRRSAYEPVGGNEGDSEYRDESGFDPTGGGDDRIEFDQATPGTYPSDEYRMGSGAVGVNSTVQPRTVSVEQLVKSSSYTGIRLNPLIEIRNAAFADADGDGIISRGEQCKVTFEIMNNSSEMLHDIRPAVAETTGNKHIHVSPGLRVEAIAPRHGVRYTATIVGDDRLKDGEAVIKVGVAQGDSEVASQVKEFRVPTKKK